MDGNGQIIGNSERLCDRFKTILQVGPYLHFHYSIHILPTATPSQGRQDSSVPKTRSPILNRQADPVYALFIDLRRNPHKTKGMRNDENSINKIPQRARHIERKDPVSIRRSDQRQRRMPICDGLVFHRSPEIRHRRGRTHMADALRSPRERRRHVLPRDADAHTEQQDIQPRGRAAAAAQRGEERPRGGCAIPYDNRRLRHRLHRRPR